LPESPPRSVPTLPRSAKVVRKLYLSPDRIQIKEVWLGNTAERLTLYRAALDNGFAGSWENTPVLALRAFNRALAR
jgi:hypothetical protein